MQPGVTSRNGGPEKFGFVEQVGQRPVPVDLQDQLGVAVYQKLRRRGRSEAVAWAISTGVAPEPS